MTRMTCFGKIQRVQTGSGHEIGWQFANGGPQPPKKGLQLHGCHEVEQRHDEVASMFRREVGVDWRAESGAIFGAPAGITRPLGGVIGSELEVQTAAGRGFQRESSDVRTEVEDKSVESRTCTMTAPQTSDAGVERVA